MKLFRLFIILLILSISLNAHAVRDELEFIDGGSIASSATLNLRHANVFDVTGTTTITGIASKGVGSVVVLYFEDALTVTHSANLYLPGAADITTETGSIIQFYEFEKGKWRCYNYVPVSAGGGVGDVTTVGDCTDGDCLDGTSDGGTEILFYDAQGATTLVGGDTAGAITLTLPIVTGTIYATGNTDVAVADGGTNSSTALNNDFVMVSSGGAIVESATITATELGLLNGVTGALYEAGGTDVADADVADNITITNLSQVQDVTATAATINTVDDGLVTEILVGGGAATSPVWGTDIPTAVTIGTKYIYRADGTDVPDADVADNITITNISQVQDITATAAEINTIDDCALTEMFVGGGAGSAPVPTTVTGTGAPVLGTSPTIATPAITTPTITTSALMVNASDLRVSTTTDAHEFSIQVYDVDDTTWRDALTFTNGNSPSVTLGASVTLAGLGLIDPASGLKSLTPVTDDADDFDDTGPDIFSGANLYGGTFIANGTGIINLPAVAAGMNFTIITLGAIAVTINPDDANQILADGVLLDNGDALLNGSTAGDIAVCQYYKDGDWVCTTNGWTDAS